MIKCKAWQGQDLTGAWDVYRKLDGVRALRVAGKVVSRKGKPLHNLAHLRFTDAEVWLGDWDKTVSAVRTSSRATTVRQADVYQLDPPDKRLFVDSVEHPTARTIRTLLRRHKAPGEDGLILRQGATWLKVKHVATYDVPVLRAVLGRPGTKYQNYLGALVTPKGNVGAGLSDEARRVHPLRWWVGKTIEVRCRALTKAGKFIEPRFVRVREDK